jgi:hypothetical protein
MFGSRILEVAIGIIFIFLLVSMICSAIREGIESWVKSRSAFLEHGIRELLHDRHAVGLARSLYTHPLVYGLYASEYRPRPSAPRLNALARGGNLPSYIPSRIFALALLDIAARGTDTRGAANRPSAPELSLPLARENVLNLENGAVQRVVLGAIDLARGDMELAIANIAAWYDSAMDRVSGAYKRATQKLLLGIGFTVAVVLNVNIIAIAHHLFRDDVERATIVAHAEAVARDSSFITGSSQAQLTRARATLDSLRLPIGWDDMELTPPWDTRVVSDPSGAVRTVRELRLWGYVFEPLVGWTLAALAAMLGAPFWFDLLNKVMIVRSTVKPHEKSPEESSEDRQTGRDRVVQIDHPVIVAPSAEAPASRPVAPTIVVEPERDPDAEADACDVAADAGTKLTDDEELPAAQGGVA